MQHYRLWLTLTLLAAAAFLWRQTNRPPEDPQAPAFTGVYRQQPASPTTDSFKFARSTDAVGVRMRDVLADLPPDIQKQFHIDTPKGRKNFHPTPFVQSMFEALPPQPALPKVHGAPQLIAPVSPDSGEPLAANATGQSAAPNKSR